MVGLRPQNYKKIESENYQKLRHPGSSYNFLNKFFDNFERSDPKKNNGRPAASKLEEN